MAAAKRERKKLEDLSEECSTFFNQVACLQMNLSDAYYILASYYYDEVAMTGFGAYALDQAEMKWFDAKLTLKYIIRRNSKVRPPDIQRPEVCKQRCADSLTAVLNMEKELTTVLQGVNAIAFNIRDLSILRMVRTLLNKQKKNEDSLTREIHELEEKERQKAGHQAQEEVETQL